jgi:flagellar assembly protein FliH
MRSSSDVFEFAPLDAAPVAPAGGGSGGGVSVAQAADVLATARAEADAIRAAAHREGFAAGHAEGLAAAQQQLAPAAHALAEAHSALGAERAQAADAVEREAVELALRLAEKALGAAIAARPEHVVDVVRGGLRRLVERDRVLVMVHPDDLELVRAATGDLRASLGGIGELDVQAERRVGRGGAIVRTAAGEVDGRLESQLERARETLLEALAEEDDA